MIMFEFELYPFAIKFCEVNFVVAQVRKSQEFVQISLAIL